MEDGRPRQRIRKTLVEIDISLCQDLFSALKTKIAADIGGDGGHVSDRN